MRPLLPVSLIEQTMGHLREGFRSGHWCGLLPGVRVLARELDVSKDTVEAALRRLEKDGCLKSGGPGRRREIVMSRDGNRPDRMMRVGLLLSAPMEHINPISQYIILKLIRRIENAGHVCFIAEKGMRDLGNKLSRITRMVLAAKADAWVVYSAPGNVARWFSGFPVPTMLMGGLSNGLSMASSSTDLSVALHAAVHCLTEHGHRRIVAVSPESWRIPAHSKSALDFLAAMEANGHRPSSYNLPMWESSPEGLEKLLISIFRITPPSALLFVEPASCVATLGFLGRKGLRIPRDISIVCMTTNPLFDLLPQRLAHFEWPMDQHVLRTVRWIERLAKGETDLQEAAFPAVFHPGETIGPASHAASL